MPRILIICTGNICRSPAAQTLLAHQLTQVGLGDWVVESAGTWALDGRPATPYMVDLMAERGLDLTTHRARSVNRRWIEQADLVLVMTHSHAEALRLEFPDQADKIHLLSAMESGQHYDITDPYGGALADYRACVTQLASLVEQGWERIVALAGENAVKRKRGV
jgi:protein-tyrosine phosphatase